MGLQNKQNVVEINQGTDDLRQHLTETEEVILKRRSVRMYKKKPVPEYMIKRILEAGRFAPSAGNCQPWKFIVVNDTEIIAGLTETTVNLCKITKKTLDYRQKGLEWVKPITKFITRLKKADFHPTPFGAVSFIADGKLGLYHGAPLVILIFKDVRGISNPDLDCGIAGQNMVLAAHAMGLGTCWVGFTKLAFQYSRKWKKFFGIEYPYKFISSIGIGYPVGEPDGMIPRETHATLWYENGERKLIY